VLERIDDNFNVTQGFEKVLTDTGERAAVVREPHRLIIVQITGDAARVVLSLRGRKKDAHGNESPAAPLVGPNQVMSSGGSMK
jgi:hypothetical protein